MGSNTLGLRLVGRLPPRDVLTRTLGTAPPFHGLRGTPATRSGRVRQQEDVWLYPLAEWEGSRLDDETASRVSATLASMAPALAALDRTGLEAELLISITQFEEQGGCEVPSPVLVAAAASGLTLSISVLAVTDLDANAGKTTH